MIKHGSESESYGIMLSLSMPGKHEEKEEIQLQPLLTFELDGGV
jgi:hypothetical protein